MKASLGVTTKFRGVFPDRLREARVRADDMSQEALAAGLQRLGHRVSSGAVVSDWERGEGFPKFATFLAICEVTNQPPGFFFGDAYTERPGPTREEQIAEAVVKKLGVSPIGVLSNFFGISLGSLDSGHEAGKSAMEGAPMDPKDQQAVIDRFAETLATRITAVQTPALQQTMKDAVAQLGQMLVPAIQAAVRDAFVRERPPKES